MPLTNDNAARQLHAAYDANALFPKTLEGAIAADDAFFTLAYCHIGASPDSPLTKSDLDAGSLV
mgnify:CR=1 FL=1